MHAEKEEERARGGLLLFFPFSFLKNFIFGVNFSTWGCNCVRLDTSFLVKDLTL